MIQRFRRVSVLLRDPILSRLPGTGPPSWRVSCFWGFGDPQRLASGIASRISNLGLICSVRREAGFRDQAARGRWRRYYTFAATGLALGDLPPTLAKRLPHYPPRAGGVDRPSRHIVAPSRSRRSAARSDRRFNRRLPANCILLQAARAASLTVSKPSWRCSGGVGTWRNRSGQITEQA